MKVTLNGATKILNDISSLENMIDQFCKDKAHVIAEVNGGIVKKESWTSQTINDGDTIELVNFVGGG